MMDKYEKLYQTKSDAGEALTRLAEIIAVLRRECPWDKVQTHESLTVCMLEEAYEAVDAIKEHDVPNLREELGDVLLQVVFHSNLSEEEGHFNMTDVINDECEKMIRRHPHVFLKERAKAIDKTVEKWDNIKNREHNVQSVTEVMENVPRALPALMRSCKIQSKASKSGLDWHNIDGPLLKVKEELDELNAAFAEGTYDNVFEEMGDLLFSVVNVSRFLKVDAEESLNEATQKFIKRFSYIEDAAAERGHALEECSSDELDELWSEAKINCTQFKEDL